MYFGQNNLLQLHVLFLGQKRQTIPMIPHSIVPSCPIKALVHVLPAGLGSNLYAISLNSSSQLWNYR